METTNSNICAEVLEKFEAFTKKPENYLGIQNNLVTGIKCLVKKLYDFTKSAEDGQSQADALPELIIQDFDDEQIWQELELQNDGKCNSFISDVAHLVARKDRLRFPVRFKGDDKSDEESEHSTNENGEENSCNNIDDNNYLNKSETLDDNSDSAKEETQELSKPRKKKRGKPSIVDDQFFKLQDFDKLDTKLEKQSSKHKDEDDSDNDTDDESIDWFGDDDGESEEENEGERYNEFYDSPEDVEGDTKWNEEDAQNSDVSENDVLNDQERKLDAGAKQVRFNLLDEEAEDLESGAPDNASTLESKTNFETRQDRLKSRISVLEAEALGEKPWQLKGEVSANSRPQNSLLEEVVEFDLTTRPAPIITEQTTLKLEDLIMQRIKDKAWDDVERKVKPVDTPQEYKKKLVLNQEKSKLSLAQIYEEDYLKQKSALDPDNDDKEEEPEAHRVIKVMMSSLFAKLDALSNFHYTPKPVLPEIKVISNVPAITMEEVAPVGTTTATLLAPEEVKAKPKGDVMGKDERTDTDRKRERRHKKMMQRDRQKEKDKRDKEVQKIRPGLGNKYSKEKTAKLLEKVTKDKNVTQMKETASGKSIRSSTAFFNQLQDEVTSHIKTKTLGNKKRKIETVTAKKIKL